jgi:hypothetical protein
MQEAIFEVTAAEMLAAEVAHEVNRAYCLTLNDFSQPEWKDAPAWQKKSALAGVRAILLDPSTTPEESHRGWFEQKLADGWKYGPVKNPETKEHPCMCRYAELPIAQRAKDFLFGAAVRAVLGFCGQCGNTP